MDKIITDTALSGIIAALSLEVRDFSLNEEQIEIKVFMNQQIPELCTELPPSIGTRALLYIQNHMVQNGLSGILSFYDKFFPPAWTSLYWSRHHTNFFPEDVFLNAIRAQSMALFLHIFDDHLVDGELPMGFLPLQIRTAAWQRFHRYTELVFEHFSSGRDIPDYFLNEYFAGVCDPSPPDTLEDYEHRFRKQIATWLIHPYHFVHHGGKEKADLFRRAYESFGVAWRILDDIWDIEVDALQGVRTAVYYLLDDEARRAWLERPLNPESAASIQRSLKENGVLDQLLNRIHNELSDAIEISGKIGLDEFGDELSRMRNALRWEGLH